MRIRRLEMILFAALIAALCLGAAAAEGQISGKVWLDQPANGLMEEGESGVSGAAVILEKIDADGGAAEAARAVTRRSGDYSLTAAEPGTYRLRIELPQELHFTFHGQDSGALPAQGRVSYTPAFTVGEEPVTLNIGATKTQAHVTFMAFEDLNKNGGRASAEPRLRNVRLQVIYDYDGETYVVAEIYTPPGGRITLDELSPGAYRARLILPRNYAVGPLGTTFSGWYNCFVPDAEGTGVTREFTLAPKDNQWIGAGMVRTDE